MKISIPKKVAAKLNAVLECVRNCLKNDEFLQRSRKKPQDFTRKRKLPFEDLMLMLLKQYRCSTQSALRRFFKEIGNKDMTMTQQSLSEQRMKIKWEAFREIFWLIGDQYYSKECDWRTWHGYTVFAIDGSKIQLPSDPNLLAKFGGTGADAAAATAQSSYLYDVLNEFIADALFDPLSSDERTLAKKHLKRFEHMPAIGRKLIIFDRGYPSADMITSLTAANCDFLFRVRRKFNLELDALPLGVHDFSFTGEDGQMHALTAVKLKLDSGETETLLTSLRDRRMGTKAFKELYFARWGVETKIGELKNNVELENFSGRVELTIRQDFYASAALANMLSIAAFEAQPIIDFGTDDSNKYEYKVNKNNAIGVLKDDFIAALTAPSARERERHFNKIVEQIAKTKTPVRPGRSRKRSPSPRNAKFHHNQKSNA